MLSEHFVIEEEEEIIPFALELQEENFNSSKSLGKISSVPSGSEAWLRWKENPTPRN